MQRTQEVIGRGSHGIVYGATDPKYVVKTIKNNDVQKIKLAEAECEIHKSLRHANILPIHSWEIQVEPPSITIYMLRQEGNLHELLENEAGVKPGGDTSKLDPRRAVSIADSLLQQMLPVLQYMTDRSVVHRDIKPENILWESRKQGAREYRFSLADFGGVKDLTIGETHAMRGSRAFMAPEMLDPFLGKQTTSLDMWSLFVTVLYVVDARFRTEVVNLDRKNDPFKASMYFVYLVLQRTDYWVAEARASPQDRGAAGLIARTRNLAHFDPKVRFSFLRMLSSKTTFLSGPEDKETGLSAKWNKWYQERQLTEEDRLKSLVEKGEIEQAIRDSHLHIAIQMSVWPQRHHERLALIQDLANVYLGVNQIQKAVMLLEYVVAARREELPEGDHTRLTSEESLAAAYLVVSVQLNGEEIKQATGVSLPYLSPLELVGRYTLDPKYEVLFDKETKFYLGEQLQWTSPNTHLRSMTSKMAVSKAVQLLKHVEAIRNKHSKSHLPSKRLLAYALSLAKLDSLVP